VSEPAFPQEKTDGHPNWYPGLTKREYFAGLAMQGMLANPALVDGDESLELNDDDAMDMGKWSVAMADAILATIAKPGVSDAEGA
jgi:hypothetical protein